MAPFWDGTFWESLEGTFGKVQFWSPSTAPSGKPPFESPLSTATAHFAMAPFGSPFRSWKYLIFDLDLSERVWTGPPPTTSLVPPTFYLENSKEKYNIYRRQAQIFKTLQKHRERKIMSNGFKIKL